MYKPFCALLMIVLSGCAANGLATVVPGEAANQAVGYGYDEDAALIRATEAAEEYCDELGQRHVVTHKERKYNGTLDEESRKAADIASSVASFAGAWTPSVNDNNDYEITLTFKCQ